MKKYITILALIITSIISAQSQLQRRYTNSRVQLVSGDIYTKDNSRIWIDYNNNIIILTFGVAGGLKDYNYNIVKKIATKVGTSIQLINQETSVVAWLDLDLADEPIKMMEDKQFLIDFSFN